MSTTEVVTVYKVTGPKGEAHIANNGFVWPRPSGKRPGKWVHAEGDLQECANGLHACRDILDIGYHMTAVGTTVWECEAKGDVLEGLNKTAFRSLRLVRRMSWSKEISALFAADCAERSMRKVGWEDDRSLAAVDISRRVALGRSTALAASAARSAAWSAAWSAASAARSVAASARSAAASARLAAAESAASAVESAAASARSAAASAARSAAASARSAAASAAVQEREKNWQRKRLLQYLEHGVDAMRMECDGWISNRLDKLDERR